MKYAGINKLFENSNQMIRIDNEKKATSMQILQSAITDKKIYPYTSKWEAITSQIKYMDKESIILQVICFLIVIPLMAIFQINGIDEMQYITIGSVFAVLIGIFVVFGIVKQYAINFAELSESCYFNVKQVIAFRMIIYGCTDLLLLLIMMFMVCGNTRKNFFEVGIYLLVPFVLSSCCYFGVLMTEMGRKNNFLLIGMGILLAAMFSVLSSYPESYAKSAFACWYVILMIGVTVLAVEVLFLFRSIEKGDILCTH